MRVVAVWLNTMEEGDWDFFFLLPCFFVNFLFWFNVDKINIKNLIIVLPRWNATSINESTWLHTWCLCGFFHLSRLREFDGRDQFCLLMAKTLGTKNLLKFK